MLLALLVSFLASALARPIALRAAPYGGWLLAILPAGLFLYFFSAGSRLDGTDALVETLDWVPALGVSFTLRLDGFARLFALIITGIGTLVTIYAGAYFAHSPPGRGATFLTLILFFMSAMLGTVLTDDLIVLFLFWEATSLLSFLLIGFDSTRYEARKAALQSLVVTAGGGLALLAGVLLIGIELGTFSISEVAARPGDLASSPLVVPILVCVLIGAFTKSAQVPFHFWLPAAMEAPTPASAYLHSATMVKLGVYLLARLDAAFADVPAFGATLVVVGSATMVVAAVRALGSDGYKAVLAQSTVGSLGVLVMLIGLAGEYAPVAVVTFILAHALYKASLFFCAGTAIHATHEGRLSQLRGLRRALPLTAIGAALAALSMAGLPSGFGFIAKEYLFEAQLEPFAGWAVIAVAVFANAVFVAIAGMAGIVPFFVGSAPDEIHDRETAGLAAGPLLLGALGLLFGVAPGLVAGTLVEPAAAALAGRPLDVSIALWHGLTPVLGLSAVVIALGLGVFAARRWIYARLARHRLLDRLLGDAGYDWLFGGTLRLAGASTRFLQNGDQHRYTAIVVTSVLVLTGAALVAGGAPFSLPPDAGAIDARSTIILGLMAAGALVAINVSSLVKAMISVGVVGFGSALIFLLNGAPDLALTQFSVEVLVVVILTALLLRVPDRTRPTRTRGEIIRDAAVSTATGLLILAALVTVVAAPLDLRLTEYFAQTSYIEAHGRNVVNVILVDYRAIDTLGEISVVAFAAVAVWGLLRRRRAQGAGS